MAEFSKDEALAFIESMRLNLAGRTGFKWLVEKLSGLAAYVESVADDNERMNRYLDSAGLRDDYESYAAAQTDLGSEGADSNLRGETDE